MAVYHLLYVERKQTGKVSSSKCLPQTIIYLLFNIKNWYSKKIFLKNRTAPLSLQFEINEKENN